MAGPEPKVAEPDVGKARKAASGIRGAVARIAGGPDQYQTFLQALETYLKGAEWKPGTKATTTELGWAVEAVDSLTIGNRVIKGEALEKLKDGLSDKVVSSTAFSAYTEEEKLLMLKAVFQEGAKGAGALPEIAEEARLAINDILKNSIRRGNPGLSYEAFVGLYAAGIIDEATLAQLAKSTAANVAAAFKRELMETGLLTEEEADRAIGKLLSKENPMDVEKWINEVVAKPNKEAKDAVDRLKGYLLSGSGTEIPTGATKSPIELELEKLGNSETAKMLEIRVKALVKAMGQLSDSKAHDAYVARVNAAFDPALVNAVTIPKGRREAALRIAEMMADAPEIEMLLQFGRNAEAEIMAALRGLRAGAQESQLGVAEYLYGTDKFGAEFAKAFWPKSARKVAGWFTPPTWGGRLGRWARLAVTMGLLYGGWKGVGRGADWYQHRKAEAARVENERLVKELEMRKKAAEEEEKRRKEEEANAAAKKKALEVASAKAYVANHLAVNSIIPSSQISPDHKKWLMGHVGAWLYLERELRTGVPMKARASITSTQWDAAIERALHDKKVLAADGLYSDEQAIDNAKVLQARERADFGVIIEAMQADKPFVGLIPVPAAPADQRPTAVRLGLVPEAVPKPAKKKNNLMMP